MVTNKSCWPFTDVEIDHFHFLLWRSERNFNIALLKHALIATIMSLHNIKFGKHWFSNPRVKKEECKIFAATLPQLTIDFRLAHWRSETD